MAGAAVTDVGGVGHSWFTVTVDTRPPVVAFGEPLIGDTTVVPYTVDEPAVLTASAKLGLGLGTALNVVVTPDTFEVETPTNRPQITLTVRAADDVDNVGVYQLVWGVPPRHWSDLPAGEFVHPTKPLIGRPSSGRLIEPGGGRVVS